VAEYRKIIGGYFDQHPWHQAVVVEVADRDDPLVAFLGETIAVTDEIYQIAISTWAAHACCYASIRLR
jgi:type 1 glutamine amidotransferase